MDLQRNQQTCKGNACDDVGRNRLGNVASLLQCRISQPSRKEGPSAGVKEPRSMQPIAARHRSGSGPVH